MPASPSRARRTRPCWSSWLTTQSAVVAGIAKPIPCANAMIAVLMPITAPLASSSGPPELPGFSGAVCWMTLSISRPCTPRSERPVALTMPAVTVESKPSGLPIATASWPGRAEPRRLEVRERQRAALHLEQREVGGRVAPDQPRAERAPVGQRRVHAVRARPPRGRS